MQRYTIFLNGKIMFRVCVRFIKGAEILSKDCRAMASAQPTRIAEMSARLWGENQEGAVICE